METALGVVGLADRMNHFPRQLSGGQEQRVTIARRHRLRSDFLLCDEPTGDLDRKSADEIMALIEELVREIQEDGFDGDPRSAGRRARAYHAAP